jgi:FlaA1/EpsC-like NDP-sugar epimerase
MTPPPGVPPRQTIRGWLVGPHRQWLLLGIDAVLVGVALYIAYLLRFDGTIPATYKAQFARFLPVVLLIRVPLHWGFGIHRWSFRLAGLSEAVRIVLTSVAGSTAFVAFPYFLRIVTPPRSVVVIEFFLTTTLVATLRFSSRLTQPWLLDQRRSRSQAGLQRAIIVGAGSAGDLLLRDLRRSSDHSYDVVGFVDDNPAKRGSSIGGRPVLGRLDDLPALARTRSVQELLFAIPSLPAERMREILAHCADLKLKYKVLPVSYTYLKDRAGEAMLSDLAPEDLLSRRQTDFDAAELRSLIEGRRVLVTGAAGSIGSEICRQLAQFGARQIVLADINENALYFLYLELSRKYPQLELAAQVVDIRDRERLQQLGREFRPQDVLHAAAHKHVPLMEWAPEEAVKNNVIGCRNVVEMAEDAGAARFVLISTDKAVYPSSIMGATKKIAERLVRERAGRSPTAFTAVRFGNVLGSAGSVVPIFKSQIATGGPVTVTHPECRRYLMTIPEAVGLVLLAGLGAHGDLCILEMGEPIRILDLARMMITLCGLVPEQDIPIVFTGLRPGEKLDEVLMTEEERRVSRMLAHRIRVIQSPYPEADLTRELAGLEDVARKGDRAGVLRALRMIVPELAVQGGDVVDATC